MTLAVTATYAADLRRSWPESSLWGFATSSDVLSTCESHLCCKTTSFQFGRSLMVIYTFDKLARGYPYQQVPKETCRNIKHPFNVCVSVRPFRGIVHPNKQTTCVGTNLLCITGSTSENPPSSARALVAKTWWSLYSAGNITSVKSSGSFT